MSNVINPFSSRVKFFVNYFHSTSNVDIGMFLFYFKKEDANHAIKNNPYDKNLFKIESKKPVEVPVLDLPSLFMYYEDSILGNHYCIDSKMMDKQSTKQYYNRYCK